MEAAVPLAIIPARVRPACRQSLSLHFGTGLRQPGGDMGDDGGNEVGRLPEQARPFHGVPDGPELRVQPRLMRILADEAGHLTGAIPRVLQAWAVVAFLVHGGVVTIICASGLILQL